MATRTHRHLLIAAAGAMTSAVPVLILSALTQPFIVEGIASAGMKE